MGKFIGETGLTYLWSKIKAVFATKEDISNKQDALVSGTNIKTVNNQSLLGGGNITIEGGSGTETDPIFTASPAYGITSSDITKWDAAAVVAEDDGSATIPDFDAEADTVWHKAQTLSSAQKAQARTNIGAQETLVSGSNIKTINNESILGSGNITNIGGDGEANVIEVVKVNGTALTPDANKAVNVVTLTQIVNHGTSDTTFSLTPNVFHVWGEVSSLTLTLATPSDASVVNLYALTFESGSTPTSFSLSGVVWQKNNALTTIEANSIYEITIRDNKATWSQWEAASS